MAHKIHIERSQVRLRFIFMGTLNLQRNCGSNISKSASTINFVCHRKQRCCLYNSVLLEVRYASPLPHLFVIIRSLKGLKIANRLKIVLFISIAGRVRWRRWLWNWKHKRKNVVNEYRRNPAKIRPLILLYCPSLNGGCQNFLICFCLIVY